MGLIVMFGILTTAAQALLEARRRFLAAGDATQAELAVWLAIGLLGYLVTSLFLHGAYLYMLWLQIALIVALRQIARLGKNTLESETPDMLPTPPSDVPGRAERISKRLETWRTTRVNGFREPHSAGIAGGRSHALLLIKERGGERPGRILRPPGAGQTGRCGVRPIYYPGQTSSCAGCRARTNYS